MGISRSARVFQQRHGLGINSRRAVPRPRGSVLVTKLNVLPRSQGQIDPQDFVQDTADRPPFEPFPPASLPRSSG